MVYLVAFYALVFAIVLGLLFSAIFSVRGPWTAPWAMFLVLFLFMFGIGMWVPPIGPTLYGVSWVPLLVIGLIVMLLIAAASPPRRRVGRDPGPEAERPSGDTVALGLGVFFWLLIFALDIVVFVRPYWL